jgi:hypothetical protein
MGLFSWLSGKGTPPSTAQSNGQMAAQSQDVVKTYLTKVWHDKEFQARVAKKIEDLKPSLGPEFAMKVCLGTIAKLVSEIPSGWNREAWEKNVVGMMHNSPPMRFSQGEALSICRLVENELRRLFGWKIELPDPVCQDKDTICINVDTAGIVWVLSRGSDRLAMIGGILTSEFLSAMQEGWSAAAFQHSDSSGRLDVSLKPCEISDHEARDLGRKLRQMLHPADDEETRELMKQVELALAFYDRGGFRIDRASDSLPMPTNESVVIWKP